MVSGKFPWISSVLRNFPDQILTVTTWGCDLVSNFLNSVSNSLDAISKWKLFPQLLTHASKSWKWRKRNRQVFNFIIENLSLSIDLPLLLAYSRADLGDSIAWLLILDILLHVPDSIRFYHKDPLLCPIFRSCSARWSLFLWKFR